MEPGDEKYPLSMHTLDIKNWRWGTGSVAPLPLTFAQSVIVGSTIYYIGGYRIVEELVRANTMDSVLMYNTDSGGWQRQSIGGTVTPSTRVGHTVTLKPSTGEIIVFGGVNPGDPDATREDYFYLLSTQGGNLTWSTRELGAVLAEDYLLVMFGAINWDNKTSIYVYSNDVRVLDVNAWTWLTSISALTPVARPSSTSDLEENDDDNTESSVSIGTIVGAVVGGVAGLAIIIGIIAFLLLRRRKNRRLEKEENKISSARMLPDEAEPYGTVKDSSESSTVDDQPPAFISSEKPALFKKNPVKPDGGY
ncbi:hypothetical protein INT45_010180 [Circinella minor]|uniref:Kelch repeat protein n=1 Tax=Circinella minor TaxID=1195481 RepID=A0A8H7SD12_9FUNG|nr:hypothetical protein INT45_010180 [Circinella minor]